MDIDTAGAMLWALGPGHSATLGRLTDTVDAAQNPDGGLPSQAGASSNAQSTALAIVGLRAAGRRPEGLRTEDGIDPYDYLRARTAAGGAIAYARGDHRTPTWVTAQALLALGDR